MKKIISRLLKKALKENRIELKEEEIEKLLETPAHSEMGDYAFPCFSLAKKLKKNPNEIALEIKEKIKTSSTNFEKIETSGAYINFFLNKANFADKIISKIKEQKQAFGKTNLGKGKKIIVEFSSPNIAKPFGIGHLRSTIIGNSIANICEFQGFKTIRINYLGDWGTQFGKLLLGYKKFGDKKKLLENQTNHLLEIYVKANKDIYEEESKEEFKKLELGNKESLELWKMFKKLSLKNFEKIYKIMGIRFDVYSGESMQNNKMGEVIAHLKEKKLLEKSDGALIINLEKYNLGICLIQKTDGTTLYATRDISSAIERYKKYKFEKMIYEVGSEQKLYFRQIFKILELMGYDWAKDCIHVNHGLYLDEGGEKFATRKGKTIFMQDIIDETILLAEKEIKKRIPKISKLELEKRAIKVAIAAIFYGDLKNNRANDIVFDIKRFISFEGDTGPYLQYSYARASSILRKSKTSNKKRLNIKKLEVQEFELVKKLSQFHEVVLNSYNNLNPSLIANYSYQLAQLFNEFYQTCPVIGSEQESFRLALVGAFKQVLKNSLNLLGITPIEEM